MWQRRFEPLNFLAIRSYNTTYTDMYLEYLSFFIMSR